MALNEYRSQPEATWDSLSNRNFYSRTRVQLDDSKHWGGFPLQSIGGSSQSPGRTRIEMGFIGAHADIGGGYGDDNRLSQVALSWMVGQAQTAGVAMNVQNINTPTGNPVIHDQSNNIRFGNPQTAPATITVQGFTGGLAGNVAYNREDRVVNGAASGTTQRTMGFGAAQAGGDRSLTNADTHRFITYNPRPANINQDTRITNDIAAIKQNGNQTGTVDMQAYVSWLRNHGYAFAGAGQF